MNKKEIKYNILLTFIGIIVLLAIVGITISYFSSKVTTTNSITTGTLVINFQDENLNAVNVSNIEPINDSDIKEKASKFEFTINNTGTTDAYVDINITDIEIPEELQDLEFRWALYSDGEKVSNGNFRNISDNKVLLTNNIEIKSKNGENSKNYELYIWISESDMDQSDMMNKTFKGAITINGNQFKQKELLTEVIKRNNDPIVTEKKDFSKLAEEDEGLVKDVDNDGNTYYFRGAVEDNYLKIDGLKWSDDSQPAYEVADKNVYSTREEAETECTNNYTKYSYQSAEECNSAIEEVGAKPGEDMLFRIVRINGDGTIRIIANGSIGKSKFNENNNSEEYAGYTYKTRTGRKVSGQSNKEYTRTIKEDEAIYYADTFTFDSTGSGVYHLVNPVPHTGKECNENKSLCEGKYTKFISTAPDGEGIAYPTLYYVTEVESETNIKYRAYQIFGEAVLDPDSEDNDSTIKTYLDTWYQEHLTKYDKILANARYCNDTTSDVQSTSNLNFESNLRLTSHTPTLICPSTDKLYGGKYDLKIGLLSADEVAFAGAVTPYNYNYSFYLHDIASNMWLMSPSKRYYYYTKVYILNYGNITEGSPIQNESSVVPVLNIKADTLYESGKGTINEPYILSVD